MFQKLPKFRNFGFLVTSMACKFFFIAFLGNSSNFKCLSLSYTVWFSAEQSCDRLQCVLVVAWAALPQTLYHPQLYCDGKILLSSVANLCQQKGSPMLLLLTRTQCTRPTRTPSSTEGLVYRQKIGLSVVDH